MTAFGARTVRRYWPFYIMLLPGVVLLLLNNYIPMFGVIIAFKDIDYAKGLFGGDWVGFDNFKYLFKTDNAWIITRNTLGYNALFIALNCVVPVAFAIMLNSIRSKFLAGFHQSVMLLPYFLSMVVISYLVYAFLEGKHGFINTNVLPALGLDPVDWYFEKKYWPFILPLVNLWKNVGYYTIIYMAALLGIDEEYYEAARIDGATKWKQITRITIPLISPVIVVMTLLQIGRIFYADFGLFYQVPRESGVLYDVTNVIDTYVYRTFLAMGDPGMSSAAGLYQAVVGFVLVLLTNWLVRSVNRENALF